MAIMDLFSTGYISIDIGFRYLKIVQVKKSKNDALTVMNFGIGDTPKGCIKNGAISDKDKVVNEISRVIREHNINAREAKIVMSGTNILTRIIMIDKVPDGEVDKKIWERSRKYSVDWIKPLTTKLERYIKRREIKYRTVCQRRSSKLYRNP